jgi:hypothetical protein
MRKASRSFILMTGVLALALAGCSSSSPDGQQTNNKDAVSSGGAIGKIFETSKPVTVAEGTPIHVVLDQSLASNANHAGDEFEASVSEPVVVGGKTVIPKGARVHGRVTEASASGRLNHVASLNLALRSVEVGGKTYELGTSGVGRTGQNHNKRNAEWIGGGAAATVPAPAPAAAPIRAPLPCPAIAPINAPPAAPPPIHSALRLL